MISATVSLSKHLNDVPDAVLIKAIEGLSKWKGPRLDKTPNRRTVVLGILEVDFQDEGRITVRYNSNSLPVSKLEEVAQKIAKEIEDDESRI